MGLQIYGIAASQNPDNVGETIVVPNIEDSRMRVLSDEHADEDGNIEAFRIIGAITKHRKIMAETDCEDDYQRRCWKHAGVPFLYVEGELANDEDHPDAQSAASLIRFCSRPDIPLKVGLSIEGGIFERGGQGDKTLVKTMATGAALTVKPCNPKCALFMKTDLLKSERDAAPPARYFEALKKSQSKTSIYENHRLMLYLQLETLKKSLADYMGGFTQMKCPHCGHAIRFFKSTKDMPNGCRDCGSNFSISQIWKALNR
jgi:ribosomal protein S27E